MRQRRKRVWWATGASATIVIVLAGILTWSPLLPWAANHYGFALSGSDGLPYRIHYAGRSYATLGMCARAGWCAGEARSCESRQWLLGRQLWPLIEVTQLNTLFGPPYPVLVPQSQPGNLTTMLLFVPHQGCYQVYALEGGP
jgi:hypothetical protein